MLDELGVTPEQKTKIEAIRKAHADDTDRKAMFTEINAVLTPEQQTKWEQMRKERHHRHHSDAGANNQ